MAWRRESNICIISYCCYIIFVFIRIGWQFIRSNIFILSNTHIFHIILIKGQRKSRRIHWVRSNWKQINCLYIHSPYVQVQVVTMVNSIPFRIYHTSTDWYNPMRSNIVRSRSTDTCAWLIRWHTAYCNSVLYMDVNVYVYSMVDWFIRFEVWVKTIIIVYARPSITITVDSIALLWNIIQKHTVRDVALYCTHLWCNTNITGVFLK